MANERVSQEKGQARIQQLTEEFPEIHRTIVVKADLIREGLKPGAGTHHAGRWALPEAPWYFEFDKEDTHSAEETTQGYIRTPIGGYFGDGVYVQFMLDTRSPYEIRYEERGRYRLYRDGEPIEEVFFTPRPQWYDRRTSSGKPMPSVIAQRQEDMLCMGALTYCEYGKDNRLCLYCNINRAESVSKGLGLERLAAKRDQDVYETMLAACQEREQRYVLVSGGVMLDSSKEADNYARIVKALRRAQKDAGNEIADISVVCQAMEPADAMKLKEAGVAYLGFNLEVWDPKLFEIICPGKAKYVGQERWLERAQKAREIFGEWRVSSDLVVGVELVHPEGFKSEDEGAASQLESVEWLLSHGVRTYGVLSRCVPGTMFAGKSSPRAEYFLRVELGRYKTALKLNKMPTSPGGSRVRSAGTSLSRDFLMYGLRGTPVAGPLQASPSRSVC